jgi:hypothetical protein
MDTDAKTNQGRDERSTQEKQKPSQNLTGTRGAAAEPRPERTTEPTNEDLKSPVRNP